MRDSLRTVIPYLHIEKVTDVLSDGPVTLFFRSTLSERYSVNNTCLEIRGSDGHETHRSIDHETLSSVIPNGIYVSSAQDVVTKLINIQSSRTVTFFSNTKCAAHIEVLLGRAIHLVMKPFCLSNRNMSFMSVTILRINCVTHPTLSIFRNLNSLFK